jgi:hypothetical protein
MGNVGSCHRRLLSRPTAAIAQQGVHQHEQLAHNSDNRDFGGLAGLAPSEVFRLQRRIEGDGDRRWHIMRLAQLCRSALDDDFALPTAGLTGDRRQPAQPGGSLSLQLPSFVITMSMAGAKMAPRAGMLSKMSKRALRPFCFFPVRSRWP